MIPINGWITHLEADCVIRTRTLREHGWDALYGMHFPATTTRPAPS